MAVKKFSFIIFCNILFDPRSCSSSVVPRYYIPNLKKNHLSPADGDRDRYHLEGLMESPSADDDGDCFSPLLLNATSVNIEAYYNKAVNYTLMVTFVSFVSHC